MLLPMKFEITEEMIEMIQEYLIQFSDYLYAGLTTGRWILTAGAVVAVIALIGHWKGLRTFFQKKRVR